MCKDVETRLSLDSNREETLSLVVYCIQSDQKAASSYCESLISQSARAGTTSHITSGFWLAAAGDHCKLHVMDGWAVLVP